MCIRDRTSFWPPGAQKTLKSGEKSAKIKVFAFFPRAFKNRDPKSSKKSSPEGQHEPQERLRRSQERPKRPQDGSKSALRAARSAPRGAQEQPGAHQKGPKRAPGRPRSAKMSFGRPPGPMLTSFWGGPGLHFQAIEASFSKLARAPPDNRKHSSK